ncbi:hypothetical protein WKI47_08425 [Saccharibacillus sacchari]|uniref:Uncharacterized protein n=1 Tax=Saccharibacillus sacchari TaxID=456493 RepID=A0ACC6PAF6_9BACL
MLKSKNYELKRGLSKVLTSIVAYTQESAWFRVLKKEIVAYMQEWGIGEIAIRKKRAIPSLNQCLKIARFGLQTCNEMSMQLGRGPDRADADVYLYKQCRRRS